MEAPPVIARVRPRFPWWLATILSAAAALVIVLYLFNPAQNSFYPRCFLYTTTGLYCPGCGSLRALHHLAHGRLKLALHYNFPLILSLPFAGLAALRYWFRWMAGKPPPTFVLRPIWIKLLAAALVLFTLLRNIPHPPFDSLAPPGGP